MAETVHRIPDRMAFKISEVSRITGIKAYVLRYWETEFAFLTPQKSKTNQRMYTKKDIENVLLIKKLLYEEKYSIAGAKRRLKEMKKERPPLPSVNLSDVRNQLQELYQLVTR